MTVELKNVTFGYVGYTILMNINLVYHSSDFLSIIGPNGGGPAGSDRAWCQIFHARRVWMRALLTLFTSGSY